MNKQHKQDAKEAIFLLFPGALIIAAIVMVIFDRDMSFCEKILLEIACNILLALPFLPY